MTKKTEAIRQCDPDCLFVYLNKAMDTLENLKEQEDKDYDAIEKAIADARESISDIEHCILWMNIKLNRAEIEMNKYRH